MNCNLKNMAKMYFGEITDCSLFLLREAISYFSRCSKSDFMLEHALSSFDQHIAQSLLKDQSDRKAIVFVLVFLSRSILRNILKGKLVRKHYMTF